jgi:hypothetical protein
MNRGQWPGLRGSVTFHPAGDKCGGHYTADLAARL